MSYRSTIRLYSLPDGGEIHVYDTFDPGVLRDGQSQQRRMNVRIPDLCDLDEELELKGGSYVIRAEGIDR